MRGGYLPRPLTTMTTTTWCRHHRQLLYSKRQHRREQLLTGWIPTLSPDDDDDDDLVSSSSSAPVLEMTISPRATARRVDPYPIDDDDLVSLSSAPVLEGAHNCGSSQMQELHMGAVAFNSSFVTILLMYKYYDFVSIKVSIS